MTVEHTGAQIRPDLYTTLNSLPEGKLGNAYTKRLLRTIHSPAFWPARKDDPRITPDMLVACLRIDPRIKGTYSERIYYFGITPSGEITLLDAWEYSPERERQAMELPTQEFILEQIQIAQERQKRLR